MQDSELLEGLNDEQAAAVTHEGSGLLILAGAGSGKTRVLTTKLAWLIKERGLDPYSILAVTFTKKAAGEMKERAIALESRAAYANIRTFHSFGAYCLRRYWQEAGVDKNFTVYDDDDSASLLAKAIPGIKKSEAAILAKRIALAKDYGLTPDDDLSVLDGGDGVFAVQYRSYQKRLEQTGNVDFGDLILLPYITLKNNALLRSDIHRRYRVIMVDEYQDSNIAQFLLLKELSGVEEGAPTYVCVVGDDDQSIYKFRGAEVQNILNFRDNFPGSDLIRLETNYRSTDMILSCAASLVSNNSGRLGKNLCSARGKGKKPTLVFLPNQDDETEFCADMIENSLNKGGAYSDWAILYRTNAQSLGFESCFLHRKIPYTLVGSLKFYEREEIKDLLSWLAFVANPRDEIAFRRIVNKPARGIGPGSQDKIVDAAFGKPLTETLDSVKLSKKAGEALKDFFSIYKTFTDFLDENKDSELKLSEFIRLIVEKSGLKEHYESQDEISGSSKSDNMEELASSALFYSCSKEGLLDFLDHIELDRSLENPEGEEKKDAVTLITLHNTKGLEYKKVIITGMESGIFPRQDKTGADLEEERRLFYVGITRARDELYFTSCASRRLYGRTSFMLPSPFLSELGKNNFRVLGQEPAAFVSYDNDPIAKKYCKGACLYHDEWGQGYIVEAFYSEENNYVIGVKFDGSSGIKRFLPKFQSKDLLIVK